MGMYGERMLPRIVNMACGQQDMRPLRRRACVSRPATWSRSVSAPDITCRSIRRRSPEVAAIEPAGLGWRLADKRLRAATVPVRWSGLDGQDLPFPDGTFDAALSTWTLCTIPDVVAALDELQRVLKPGGTLHFAEHGLAPDESVRRWQRRLEPVQKVVFGGCHLTRPIADLLTGAGFTITELDVFYQTRAPKFGGASCLGIAKARTSTARTR